MSMRNEPPDPLALSERSESSGIDALIDEAARRLVAGEPSSSLRSSVRDRIARRRLAWFVVPAWGMAAATVVAVLIVGRATPPHGAGAVGTPGSGPPFEHGSARPTDHPATKSNVPTVALQANEPAVIQPEPSAPRQLARRRAADVAAAPEEESPIPPITIELLATAPLRAVLIAADVSSGVMPIDIAPLQIEPLLGE